MPKFKSLPLSALLLSACLPIAPQVSPAPTGEVGIQIIWPQDLQGFATKASYDEIEKLGVKTMRVKLTDDDRTHELSVAFSERKVAFKGVKSGRVSVTLECLNSSDKVLFKGNASGFFSIFSSLNLPVAVETMADWRPPAIPGKNDFTNSLGMKFIKINPGTFSMGSPASESGRDGDETQHQVTLTQAYYLQSTEVTQWQWEAVMGDNPSHFNKNNPNLPVDRVSWEDVQSFITKLNALKEGTYRLPTEAEWEYAARAGSKTAYACGDSESCLANMGWYGENSNRETQPVGQKQANAWGLYDMHGNVWEWVNDWYLEDYYERSPARDPQGPSAGSNRVARGGGWDAYASYARSAYRDGGSSDNRYTGDIGFRLVRRP